MALFFFNQLYFHFDLIAYFNHLSDTTTHTKNESILTTQNQLSTPQLLLNGFLFFTDFVSFHNLIHDTQKNEPFNQSQSIIFCPILRHGSKQNC